MIRMLRSLAATFGVFIILCVPTMVYAEDVLSGPCSQVPNAVACQERNQSTSSNSLYGANGVITKATKLVAMLVGIAAVIVIVIAGLQYALSSGDSTKVNNAKNMILYAVIGLIIAMIAQGIVLFVLNKL